MISKSKNSPINQKTRSSKREIDTLCKFAETLHGGKLVPIVNDYQKSKDPASNGKVTVVKKMRIVERVYGLKDRQNEEQLLISYTTQKRTAKPKIAIPKSTPKPDPTVTKVIEQPVETINISYNSNETHQFHGVIRYLTEKCGGNVHKEGIVNITSSSIIKESSTFDDGYPDPFNVADLDNIESSFASDYEKNAWLCYDFIQRRVKPSHYSIRTYVGGPNHLRSWRIEGSNDKMKWSKLDEQVSSELFDNIGKSITFHINKTVKVDFYRFLRVKLAGPTITGIHILNVSALEFFGEVAECNDEENKNVHEPLGKNLNSPRRQHS